MFICHERGTKKKSESPMGIDPRPPTDLLGALTTELRETLGELDHLLGSYVTCVLYIARISNVESIICVINNELDGKFLFPTLVTNEHIFIIYSPSLTSTIFIIFLKNSST